MSGTQDFNGIPAGTYNATQLSGTITNNSFRGIILFLNVTAVSGTGGLKVYVRIIDPISGNTGTMFLATTGVTTTGTFFYAIYPGITSGFTQNYNSILPANFVVGVIPSDGSNYTYSLNYELLP